MSYAATAPLRGRGAHRAAHDRRLPAARAPAPRAPRGRRVGRRNPVDAVDQDLRHAGDTERDDRQTRHAGLDHAPGHPLASGSRGPARRSPPSRSPTSVRVPSRRTCPSSPRHAPRSAQLVAHRPVAREQVDDVGERGDELAAQVEVGERVLLGAERAQRDHDGRVRPDLRARCGRRRAPARRAIRSGSMPLGIVTTRPPGTRKVSTVSRRTDSATATIRCRPAQQGGVHRPPDTVLDLAPAPCRSAGTRSTCDGRPARARST